MMFDPARYIFHDIKGQELSEEIYQKARAKFIQTLESANYDPQVDLKIPKFYFTVDPATLDIMFGSGREFKNDSRNISEIQKLFPQRKCHRYIFYNEHGDLLPSTLQQFYRNKLTEIRHETGYRSIMEQRLKQTHHIAVIENSSFQYIREDPNEEPTFLEKMCMKSFDNREVKREALYIRSKKSWSRKQGKKYTFYQADGETLLPEHLQKYYTTNLRQALLVCGYNQILKEDKVEQQTAFSFKLVNPDSSRLVDRIELIHNIGQTETALELCLSLLQSGRQWKTGGVYMRKKRQRKESTPRKRKEKVEKIVEKADKVPKVPEARYKQILKKPIPGTRSGRDKRRYWFYGDDRKPMDETSQKVYRNILNCVFKKHDYQVTDDFRKGIVYHFRIVNNCQIHYIPQPGDPPNTKLSKMVMTFDPAYAAFCHQDSKFTLINPEGRLLCGFFKHRARTRLLFYLSYYKYTHECDKDVPQHTLIYTEATRSFTYKKQEGQPKTVLETLDLSMNEEMRKIKFEFRRTRCQETQTEEYLRIASIVRNEPLIMSGNSETQKDIKLKSVYDDLLQKRTDEEIQTYQVAGGYANSFDIEEFQFSCVNKQELISRCFTLAQNAGFQFKIFNQELQHDDKRIRLQCSYQSITRKPCCFFVRYAQNLATKEYSLMDFDDMHSHPLNDCVKELIDLQTGPTWLPSKVESCWLFQSVSFGKSQREMLAQQLMLGVSLGRTSVYEKERFVCEVHSKTVDLAHMMECELLKSRLTHELVDLMKLTNPKNILVFPRLNFSAFTEEMLMSVCEQFLSLSDCILQIVHQGKWKDTTPRIRDVRFI